MANVKTTLTVAGDGTSNSFSNTKNYTEEIVSKFYVDWSDTFTDLIAFSPDEFVDSLLDGIFKEEK